MKYKWFFNKYSIYNIEDSTEDWLYCIKKANLQIDFKKNFWNAYNNTNKAKYQMTKEIFNSCPYLDKIFKNYTVEFVILGGSALYNIIDNVSDYDIDVFIKEPLENIEQPNNECLFYKGRKLHWYYNNLVAFNNNIKELLLYKAELYFLKKKNILYGNASNLIKLIKENKIIWINNYLQNNYNNIINSYNNFELIINNINYLYQPKNIAYFILFYFVVTKQKINYYLIKKIKRCAFIHLNISNIKKTKKLIFLLKKYCEEELRC